MGTLTSHSVEETQEIARQWATQAREGFVIGLIGDLGSGKTQFVKGIAHGLDCPAKVHSPTFALLHIYEGGRLTLHHLDLYRLKDASDVASAGLLEYIGQGLTVIEWADRLWPDAHPAAASGLRIRLATFHTLEANVRQISYEDFGD